MFITAEDIADRVWRYRRLLTFNKIELAGEKGEFGQIVVDDIYGTGILIQDEEKIMDAIEEFMLHHEDYIEDAIQRHLELSQ